jgi:hypothetical protein
MSQNTLLLRPDMGGRLLPCAIAAVIALLGVSDALAAEAGHGPSEVVFLLQLIVLMLVGRLLGELMQQIGQPSARWRSWWGTAPGSSTWRNAQNASWYQ